MVMVHVGSPLIYVRTHALSLRRHRDDILV